MTSMKMYFIVTLLGLAIAVCTVKENAATVYPTTNENYKWDLRDFFAGELLTYTLGSTTTQFTLQSPLAQLSPSAQHVSSAEEIVAARARMQTRQRAWRNQFAFISYDSFTSQIDLYYSEDSQADSNLAPKFTKKITIVKSIFIQCFDLDYLDADTWIVDCTKTNTKPLGNVFYIVSKSGSVQTIENNNFNQYKVTTKRIIQQQTILNQLGREVHHIYRTTPAYATQFSGLDVASLLEVFTVINGKLSEIPYILDTVTLALLLKEPEPEFFQLSIVDFKVLSNGNIYLLDAYKGVYVLQLQGNGEFLLVDYFKSNDKAFGLEADFQLQSDGSSLFVLTVLFSDYIRIFERGSGYRAYILPFAASYPSSVHFTQDYIVLQSKGYTYVYNIEENILISKTVIDGSQQILVNPYASELIAITNIDAQRYTISNGYLVTDKLISTTVLQNFKILATDQQKNRCETTITYRVLENNDATIYELKQLTLPSTVRDYPDPYPLGPLASGPNLQYTQLSTPGSQITTRVVSIWDLSLTDVVLPPPSSVVYGDIVALDEDHFIQLIQTQDLKVTKYRCLSQSLYYHVAQCQVLSNYVAFNVHNRKNFQWWINGSDNFLISLTSDYKVLFIVQESGQEEKQTYIEYPNKIENKIASVNVYKERFVVVLENKKQIDFYSVYTNELIYSLDEAGIRKLGFTGNWNPKRIYYNRAHKNYLFFIVNNDNIVVADLHSQIALLKVLPCLASAEIELAIGEDSFFIIQRTPTSSLIQEYDLVNLSQIKFLKSLPLYWYTLQTPLTADFSSDTGDLFVRAYDSKTQQSVILVYGSLRLAHNSLLQVITLGFKIDDGKQLLLAGAGSSQMFLYVNTGINQRTITFLRNPLLFVTPTYQSNSYYAQQDLRYKITNFIDVTPLSYIKTINLINTQTKLRIDPNLSINFVAKTSSDSNVPINYSWFDGSVTEINIDCQQCDEYIQVIQSVNQVNYGALPNQVIRDVTEYPENRFVFLANSKVIITDSDSQIITQVTLSLGESDYCYQVTVNKDGTFIYAACMISSQPSVVAVSCAQTARDVECFRYNKPQKLDGITNFGKIRVIGKSLIVLSTNVNNVSQNEGALFIYNILDQDGQFQLYSYNVIGTKFFNTGATSYISDYTISEYEINSVFYYKIYVMDINQGLYILNGIITSGIFVYQTDFERLNIQDFLETAGQYTTNSQYLQIALTQDPIISGTNLIHDILFTTNNQAHYGVRITFDLNSLPKPKIKTKKVAYILNQFGTYTALNKLSVKNGFAAIVYTNLSDTVLATYQIPAFKDGQIPLVRFTGGINTQYAYPQVNEFIALVHGSIPRLLSNIKFDRSKPRLVITYDLLSNYYLEIFNENNQVVPQELYFFISNGQSSDKANGPLTLSDKSMKFLQI